MSTDDSIRTDASTVHRSALKIDAATVDSHRDVVDPPTAEAKTVIRSIASLSESNSGSEVGSVIPVNLSGNLSGNLSENLSGNPPGSLSAPIDRTPAAVAKVLLGQRLNHFLLEEMIGGGGMGAVFRAHDEQLDRTVAIKVIPFVSEDADLQRRFRNESQSAAKLDHPRIAKVFDTGNHGQWHYIVFEYVEGTNIRDWVQQHGPLSIDEAVFYTVQLADALQHVASRGIVHRDIKPSNVLIAGDGKIKLVDMGLARSESFELSEDMTASGVTLGTFDYISPEQASDPRDADLRSDLYSLGCTLYFMLTGSPPYPGGTMLQKLLSHGNAPPPDARTLRGEVSVNLVAVIQKMLAKKPADRYQTAGDLIADLHVVAARDGLTRSRQAGSFVASEPNPLVAWLERHLPWVAALTLLIAVAGWLHLESVATRDDIVVPATASRPVRVTVPPSQTATGDVEADAAAGSPTIGMPSESDPSNLIGDSTGGVPFAIVPALETPRLTDFPVPPELITSARVGEMRPGDMRLGELRIGDVRPGDYRSDPPGSTAPSARTETAAIAGSRSPSAASTPTVSPPVSPTVSPTQAGSASTTGAPAAGLLATSPKSSELSKSALAMEMAMMSGLPLVADPNADVNPIPRTAIPGQPASTGVDVPPARDQLNRDQINRDQINRDQLNRDQAAILGGAVGSAGNDFVGNQTRPRQSRWNESAIVPTIVPAIVPTIVRIVGPALVNQSRADLGDEPIVLFDSSGAALASSLADALRIAKRYAITRIDVAVPVLITEPVRVDLDHLRITSSVGGGSVIVFQPGPRLSMEPSEMFSVGDHPIEFNDLHFVWNVPSDELDGGTMFKLHENRSIELTDCTITINNPSLREAVYAFDIVTDPEKRGVANRSQRDPSMINILGFRDGGDAVGVQDVFPLVDLKLYNVIVRGQISMIHMDYAAKLWLDWDNGLLAVTDRMIDTAGARLPPPPGSGAIKLSMMRVTAHVPKGIVRTRLGVSGSHAVPIDRLARKSVFIVDPALPHFEITGLPPQDVKSQWLDIEGSGNAYVVDPALNDPLFQISTLDGQVLTTRFSELSTKTPGWVDENRPRWSVKWASIRLTDLAAGNRRASDYRQVNGVSPPGFDEKSLPTLPIASGTVIGSP